MARPNHLLWRVDHGSIHLIDTTTARPTTFLRSFRIENEPFLVDRPLESGRKPLSKQVLTVPPLIQARRPVE